MFCVCRGFESLAADGRRVDDIVYARIGDRPLRFLAALMGVVNGHKELEGDVGGNLEQSSNIQAIIDFFGPTNFHAIDGSFRELTLILAKRSCSR
jgi:hypothetical protein